MPKILTDAKPSRLLTGGADLISIETMYSLEETLAAVRAANLWETCL